MAHDATQAGQEHEARSLRLRAEAIADTLAAGRHRSRLLGRGTDPYDARPYTPGDPVRELDWRLLARTGRPFLRRRVAETGVRLAIVLDHSASMSLHGKLPRARELAAALASVAWRTGDRVSIATHAEAGEPPRLTPTRATPAQVLLALLEPEPRPGATLAEAIPPASALRGVDVLIAIGDTFEPAPDLVRALAGARGGPAGRRRRVVLCQLLHPSETDLSRVPSRARDPESGRVVATGARWTPADYRRAFESHTASLRGGLATRGCRFVSVRTNEATIAPLRRLLRAIAPRS